MEISVHGGFPEINIFSTPFTQTKHFSCPEKVIKMLCSTVWFRLSFSVFKMQTTSYCVSLQVLLTSLFRLRAVSQLVPQHSSTLPYFNSADNYNRICFLVSFLLVFKFVSDIVVCSRFYCSNWF